MDVTKILQGLRSKEVKIAVLGVGHVGLPTALGFADLGWSVIGADSDSAKMDRMRKGETPFFEPGLDDLLKKHVDNPHFQLTSDVEAAIREATVLFLCVGTPQKENGEADLTEIEVLARTIARNLNGYKLIVEKSTVPAITGQWIRRTISRHSHNAAQATAAKKNGNGQAKKVEALQESREPMFDVASNPEFLQEGKAIENFFRPDRVVCGVNSEVAKQLLEELYSPLNCTMLFADLTTAELIKHAANAFLTTKISFINMVADICEAVGADVTKVAQGIGLDSRIGTPFLNAGLGYGGYCFPKDVAAFMRVAESHNVNAGLLAAVQSINDRRVERLLKKIREALWIVRGKTIGVLGLAFKGGTDDIREAPALRVVEALMEEGAVLKLYDPKAMPNTKELIPEGTPRVTYTDSAYEAADQSHALLILTEWDDFRELDLTRLYDTMQVPIIVDGRNLFDPATMWDAGFEYYCLGRPEIHSTLHRSSMLPIGPYAAEIPVRRTSENEETVGAQAVR